MEFVKVQEAQGITTLTIDRPASLNALNVQVLMELKEALQSVKSSVVILTGAGPKAFVAGADIAGMVEFSPAEAQKFAELGQSVMRLIQEASFTSIAAINGFALGGGCELAMACDLIYASDNAKLGLPETNLGIIPGFGGTVTMVHKVGVQRALELVLTGKMLDAPSAKAWGLVLEVFPATELMTKVLEIATQISQKGTESINAARRLVKAAMLAQMPSAFKAEQEAFASLFKTHEPKEGMSAFLQKRKPVFR